MMHEYGQQYVRCVDMVVYYNDNGQTMRNINVPIAINILEDPEIPPTGSLRLGQLGCTESGVRALVAGIWVDNTR